MGQQQVIRFDRNNGPVNAPGTPNKISELDNNPDNRRQSG